MERNFRCKIYIMQLQPIFLNTSNFIRRIFSKEVVELNPVDYTYLGSFEMCCRREMGQTNWTDRMRNEGVLRIVKEERNILHTIKRRANCIGHILRRDCLLKYVTERKVEVN